MVKKRNITSVEEIDFEKLDNLAERELKQTNNKITKKQLLIGLQDKIIEYRNKGLSQKSIVKILKEIGVKISQKDLSIFLKELGLNNKKNKSKSKKTANADFVKELQDPNYHGRVADDDL